MNLSNFKNYFVFRINYFFRLFNHDIDKIVIYIIFWGIIFFYNFQNEWLYLLYYLIPPLYYHTKREDIQFIDKISNNNSYFFIVCEYLLFSLFTFLLLFNKIDQKLIHIIGFLICFLLPSLKIRNIQWTKKLNLTFIPIDAYEWKAFMRQKPINFLFTYFLLVLSCYHPFTLGIMSFLFCGTINSIYAITEPKEIYCMYFENETIDDKIVSSLKFNIKITLPIFIISILININLAHIVFFIYCFLLMFHVEIVLRKYANYVLDYNKNKTINSMKIIEIIISIILVIPWLVNYYQLKKECASKINKYARS